MVIGSMPLADMARKERLGEWFEAYNQAVEECARLLTKRPDVTPGLMRNLKRRVPR